ncbi:uncharacterized protein LOC100178977 [Ciona intestinalis]
MMRKLLYHRGVDDSTATYVTDYVIGGILILYSVVLLGIAIFSKRAARRQKSNKIANSTFDTSANLSNRTENVETDFLASGLSPASSQERQNSQESWQTPSAVPLLLLTSLMFGLCGVMHILGGSTHEWAQRTADYSSTSSTEPLLILTSTVSARRALLLSFVSWQLANIFGGFVAACFLLMVRYVFMEEIEAGLDEGKQGRERSSSKESNQSYELNVTSSEVLLQVDNTKKTREYELNNPTRKKWCSIVGRVLILLSVVVTAINTVYHGWNIFSFVADLNTDAQQISHLMQNAKGLSETTITEMSGNGVPQVTTYVTLDTNKESARFGDDLKGVTTMPVDFGGFSSQAASQVNYTEMWGMDAAVPLLGICVFIYAMVVTYFVLSHLKWNESFPKQARFTMGAQNALCLPLQNRCPRKASRCVWFSKSLIRTFRSIGAWIVLCSGSIQFSFTSKCSGDNAFKQLGCPFPDAFNHNAVYHVVLGLGMTFIFLGEVFKFVRAISARKENVTV